VLWIALGYNYSFHAREHKYDPVPAHLCMRTNHSTSSSGALQAAWTTLSTCDGATVTKRCRCWRSQKSARSDRRSRMALCVFKVAASGLYSTLWSTVHPATCPGSTPALISHQLASPDANLACEICHFTEPEETKLLCDACGTGWHMECMDKELQDQEVPEGAWICPQCGADGVELSHAEQANHPAPAITHNVAEAEARLPI